MISTDISIIIPVFNEAESLMPLYDRIITSINKLENEQRIKKNSYDLWFINDGSTDSSQTILQKLHENDPNAHFILFRRNFGKAAALEAGFKHCTGKIVFTMDADLQDDPCEMERFLDKLNEGYDLVSGWKKDRHDPLEKRLPSKLFNSFTARISGIPLHDFNCGFKAYKREVIIYIYIYGELHRYIPVLASRKGFRITEIVVKHNARKYGKSKYGIERYLRGLFDSLTVAFLSKFYDRPMYFFGRIGLGLFSIGFINCLYLAGCKLAGQAIGTRPLLSLGILCIILGVHFICTGFIGDMLVDATYRNRYEESHIKEIE